MDEKIKVIFECGCGRELDACFYEDEPNDFFFCECGNIYEITRPEIIRKEFDKC